ncbi:TraC family protein [Hyphomicrobium sp. 2TAF46]|uniref:TraC family protein n=1 Tax=Hyphomicrobium sp. 2TAF46 TaxID=3233019 RepID=UPI003F91AEB6
MTKAHPVKKAKAQSAVLTSIDKQIEALQAKRTTMMRKRRETIGLLCERAGLHLIDADVTAIEDALREVAQRFQVGIPAGSAPRKRSEAS